ncbi:MAG TPA: dTMP kinase [Spirochaetia bacterium]|nr:dTMP kinase [Spirochaetia bacterium]
MLPAERGRLRRFIVLEGVDGAGTTTQLKALGAALSAAGEPHWISAEPTGRPEGALIRRILGGELEAAPATVAYLFAADRCEHLYGSGGIVERLGRGEAVVCDRYILSSLAYQGATCGIELPLYLNDRFPLPSLLIYFDVDPRQSMSRIDGRERREIYELLPFQERVRAAYEEALARFEGGPMRILRVDAGLPAAEVGRAVLAAVGEELGLDLSAGSRE